MAKINSGKILFFSGSDVSKFSSIISMTPPHQRLQLFLSYAAIAAIVCQCVLTWFFLPFEYASAYGLLIASPGIYANVQATQALDVCSRAWSIAGLALPLAVWVTLLGIAWPK